MKNWIVLFWTVIFTTSLLTGCNSSNEVKQEKTPQEKVEVGGQTFPVTITDATGAVITISEKPTKIVSLMPSVTETLFALGADDFVVGRTDWCNYPLDKIEAIPSVGQMNFDLEMLLSLEPDLVLAHEGGISEAGTKLDQIRDAGINVVVVANSDSFNGVYEAIEFVAKVTGYEESATHINEELRQSLKDLKDKTANAENQVTAWLEVDPSLWTTGKDTFMHEILETLHVKNGADKSSGWVQFSEEDVIVMNPDVIITTYGHYIDKSKELILQRDGWGIVEAVQNERIYDVDGDRLTRPGPRLAQGVEELAKLIYPDVFKD